MVMSKVRDVITYLLYETTSGGYKNKLYNDTISGKTAAIFYVVVTYIIILLWYCTVVAMAPGLSCMLITRLHCVLYIINV